MKNSVLIVSSVASMIEQFNMPNIKLLIGMGFEVHVGCNFESGNNISDEKISQLKSELSDLGVEFYQIDFSRNVYQILMNFKAYQQLKEIVARHSFNFIHCHSPIGGVCSRIVGAQLNTKVIYTAHGFHFYKGASIFNWFVYYPIEKILSKYTDLIITINKEDFEFSKKNFGQNKTEFIYGIGVDINKYNKKSHLKEDLKNSLGINENDIIILSVGELNKNKNHKIIIKAFSNFKDKNIHYIICGKGKLESYLFDLSNEIGISNQVHFLGYRDDVSEIYKISDIFAFPSFREGLSVSLMEAIATGMPVVCSNIRGNTDLVEDQYNGFIIRSNDSSQYADKFMKLIDDMELRNFMSINGLNKVQDYNIDSVMNKTREIYLRYKHD